MLKQIKKLFRALSNLFFKYTTAIMILIFAVGIFLIILHITYHQELLFSSSQINKNFFLNQTFLDKTFLLLMIFFVILMFFLFYIIQKLKKYIDKSEDYLLQIQNTNTRLEHEVEDKKKLSSELLKTNKKQWELAFFDNLTSLANRRLLEDRMEKLISRCIRDHEKFGVLFLDLDGFKNINDSLGHMVGDKFLQEIAKKINNELRESDTLARLGGDEFVIIAENLKDNSELSKVAFKTLSTVREPVIINGIEIFSSVSIGMVVYPDDASTVQDLIMKADLAMYRAKDLGKNNYCFYSNELQEDADKNFVIISDLNKALQKKEIEIYYQPQIDITTNKVVGIEALSRWKHHKLSYIEPEKFINIAESLGLINELDTFVLQTACNDYKSWEEALGYHLKLSLNISVSEIYNHNFIDEIIKQIELFKITNFNIELELTESVLVKDIEKVQDILHKINRHSIRLAIDDFGTGYSTFKYLSIFPISTIKIDKSFINNFLHKEQSLFIIKAILNLSELLNIDVIAEGVETKEQLDKLKELGCKYCQGYYFSKPIPQKEFLQFLINHNLKS